jgi:hypothetical protein
VIGSSSDAEILEQNLQEAQGKAQVPQTVIGSPSDAEVLGGEQKLATQNQQEAKQ